MTAAACEVWFYHLERTALDQALPELLEKTLPEGWKALVRTRRSGAAGAAGRLALDLARRQLPAARRRRRGARPRASRSC